MASLNELPLDILENNIFRYLDAVAIQELSYVNKSLFKRISPVMETFQKLGIPLQDRYQVLTLPYHQRLDISYQQQYDAPVLSRGNIEKYKSLKSIKWHFPLISVPINLYSKISKYLPSSSNTDLTVHCDFDIKEFDKVEKKRINSINFTPDLLVEQAEDLDMLTLLDYLPSTRVNCLQFSFQLTQPSVAKLSNKLAGICELYLSNCLIMDEGLEILLDHINQLQTLDLQNNELTDRSIVKLAKKVPMTNIRRLILSLNSMEHAGLEAISKALPESKIQDIDIDKNSLADGDLQQLMAVLPKTKLTRFLYGDPISKESQILFIQNVKETQINLVYMTIDVGLLPDLLDSIVLSKVNDLSTFNPITDRGLKQIAKRINDLPLHSLDLDDCEITDKGIKEFFKNIGKSKLCELDLSGNQFSQAGYKAILKGLPKTNIKKLYIGNTPSNPDVLDYDAAVWFTNVPRENDFRKPGVLVEFEDEDSTAMVEDEEREDLSDEK
ncbi:hypothetical protein HK103_007633 [Boothiomyces macroporosus]|uniref:F-box domain-containing protein n=1 Tax=Boothiomyces macroporosus TaxID=261099 RepID=A0AAD5UC58_9FUNG|nr:hypothetical protein HK103_007633 [Boothiomyces macroporosus]